MVIWEITAPFQIALLITSIVSVTEVCWWYGLFGSAQVAPWTSQPTAANRLISQQQCLAQPHLLLPLAVAQPHSLLPLAVAQPHLLLPLAVAQPHLAAAQAHQHLAPAEQNPLDLMRHLQTLTELGTRQLSALVQQHLLLGLA